MPSLYHNDGEFMNDRNTTWLSQRIVTYDIHGRARSLTFRQSISPCEEYFKHLGPFGTASTKKLNGTMHKRSYTRGETKLQEAHDTEAKLKDSPNMKKRRPKKKLDVMTVCEEKNEDNISTNNKSIQANRRRTSSIIFVNERRISTGQFVVKHDDHHAFRESDLSIVGDENVPTCNDSHFDEITVLSSRSEDNTVNHTDDRLRRTSRSSGTGSLLDLSQRSPRISRDNTAPLSKEGRLQHGKSYQNIYGQHAGKKGQRGKSRGAKLRTTMSVESLVLVDVSILPFIGFKIVYDVFCTYEHITGL